MTIVMRRALAGLAAAALASIALAAGPGPARPTCVLADGDFHVGLVIHGNQTAHTFCLAFNASTPTFDAGTRSISGEEVLMLSRVRYQAVDFGGSLGRGVCQVDDEPATPPGGFTTRNCFGNPYWVLWRASPGGWVSAPSGISNQRVADGEAEGLSFGSAKPPLAVCLGPQPWPAPGATASAPGSPPVGAGSGPVSAPTTAGVAAGTVPNASSAGASASPDIGPHPHGRGGPGGLTAPLSSQPQLGLGAAIAAAFVRLHETWSSSVPGWTAAVGAAAALTVLLLTRLLLNRRGR